MSDCSRNSQCTMKCPLFIASCEARESCLLKTVLSREEMLLNAVAEYSPVGYYIVDHLTDEVLYCNMEFCRIWRITHLAEKMLRGELKNQEIVAECRRIVADVPSLEAAIAPLRDSENPVTGAGKIVFSTGQIVQWFSGPVCEQVGHYAGRLYVCEDITEQKATEEQLEWHQSFFKNLVHQRTVELEISNRKLQEEIVVRQAEQKNLERYQILAGQAHDIILFLTPDGQIIEANEAAVRCYGFSRRELLHMTVFDLRPSAERHEVREQLDQAETKGILFETVHRRRDGSLFPVEVNAQGTVMQGERVVLNIIRDISEQKRLEARLYYLAHYDSLTDTPNRYSLENFIKSLLAGTATGNSLLFIDIDNFKRINDLYGHTAGDKLLVEIAACLKQILRQVDFLARLGGDEFAIVLPGVDITEAKAIAAHILRTMGKRTFFLSGGISLRVTASIGISALDDATDFGHLFSYADTALYVAKEEGRNRAVAIENDDEKVKFSAMNRLLTLITDALEEKRLCLHFQPICQSDMQVIHYEALVRIHADDRIIFPGEFIPVAERFGLMSAIDKWVIRAALDCLERNAQVVLFVNLSGASLGDDALLDWIELSIRQGNVEPARIGFEVTETAAVRDLAKAEHWIRRLKALGCRFALDDFGVGFSSFSYLHILPVDYLKIDGTFIRNLDKDPAQKAIVQAMNAAAHALGKKTIAEFVENQAVWEIIRQLDVDCGQGYYLGKPAAALPSLW